MKNSMILSLAILLTSCSGGTVGDANVPGDPDDKRPFDGISVDEVIRLTGNEPFWGGEVGGGALLYTTPDNPDGERVPVSRFAGRGGLSFSGEMAGTALTLVVTPGDCSDTMTDRRYPFVATLQLGEETRVGCGWTDRQPFSGPKNP